MDAVPDYEEYVDAELEVAARRGRHRRWVVLGCIAALVATVVVVMVTQPALLDRFTKPSPSEILDMPEKSSMKDAHVVVETGTYHIEGLIVFKPMMALDLDTVLATDASGRSVLTRVVDDVSYTKVGNNGWFRDKDDSVRKVFASVAPVVGIDVKLIGEEDLPQGRAWHVQASVVGWGPATDVWVREVDGYLLKIRETITMAFDEFNSGETVAAPI